MASSYTTGFSFEKIATGEQSGTWGTTSNHNWDIVDRLASYKAVALSDASTATLTVREASPGSGTENLQDGMYRMIKFTGTLSQGCTVTIAPDTAPAWFMIENATSGSQSLAMKQGSGAGASVTVQNGKNVLIYCDGAGSGAIVTDALADLQIGTLECTGAAAIDGATTFSSTVTVGVDDTGYDVKFFGDTASRYWLWDTSADGSVQRGTLTVGVDDTGHDVKFFGATAGSYWQWDESADGVTQVGTLTVGVDDAGHDVKFFGATASRYMLWDESADSLLLPDNTKAVFGTGSDLEIYHDASNSYIVDSGTGNLKIQGSQVDILGSGETMATFVDDGAVTLYHNNVAKVATSANGASITGTLLATTDTDTTNTGSVTLDFAANQNFVLTFTGNVTLANPTTEQVGQSGIICCIQDATGSRTLSLETDYETAGGAGITLSTAASSVDIIPYFVKASGSIQLGAVQLAFSQGEHLCLYLEHKILVVVLYLHMR